MLDRFILSHYTEREFNADFVRESERSIFGTYYINAFAHIGQENALRRLAGLPVLRAQFPEEKIQAVLARYGQLRGKSWRQALLSSPYRADYLVWDTASHPEWEIPENDGFEKLFESEGIRVYKI